MMRTRKAMEEPPRKKVKHVKNRTSKPKTSTTEQRDVAPFKIAYTDSPPVATPSSNKKRKRTRSYTDPEFQPHVFDEKLSVNYVVKPASAWKATRRYKSFIIDSSTLHQGDIVYVNNDENDVPPPSPGPDEYAVFDIGSQWVAQVLEVRAKDEHHVYLRVFWLYRPADLPPELTPEPSYHGRYELIPSNDMQIIDAMTVNGKVEALEHWVEQDEDPSQDRDWKAEIYWRQTYDLRTQKLSELPRHCICNQPTNPERMMVRCSKSTCGLWMHAACIEKDAVERLASGAPVTSKASKRVSLNGSMESGALTVDGDEAITVADVISNPIRLVTGKLKTPAKATDKATKRASASDSRAAPKGRTAFEATVFKPEGSGSKPGRYMLKIVQTDLTSGKETEWDEDIKCLSCHSKVL